MAETSAVQPALLRLARLFPVSTDRLFQALMNEAEVAAWLHPAGMTCAECRWPARVGTNWRLVLVNSDGRRFPVGGRFLEIVPSRLVRLTWIWEEHDYAGIETIATLSVEPKAEGTLLTLEQQGLPDEKARRAHAQGFGASLDNLSQHVRSTTSREGAKA